MHSPSNYFVLLTFRKQVELIEKRAEKKETCTPVTSGSQWGSRYGASWGDESIKVPDDGIIY